MRKKSKSFRGSKSITNDRHRSVIAMIHSTAIDSPLVIDFGSESLREAFRIWWHPYDMGPDFDELCGKGTFKSFKRGNVHGFRRVTQSTVRSGASIERDRLDPMNPNLRKRFAKLLKKRTSAAKAPVKVRIRLNYPLTEDRTKVVTIDRRYPGAIFALTHDFYREIYAEDVRRGGKNGPSGKGPLLNRGNGPLVWGHDIGDLVFERCVYKKTPKDTEVEGEFSFFIGS